MRGSKILNFCPHLPLISFMGVEGRMDLEIWWQKKTLRLRYARSWIVSPSKETSNKSAALANGTASRPRSASEVSRKVSARSRKQLRFPLISFMDGSF